MAEKKLSPRQRMINMMYLVLTALLALNVSKEVLNSFFEVNMGIERTRTNFESTALGVYKDFDNAAENNPEKFSTVRDQAYEVKEQADELSLFLQEMKYDLVQKADGGKVYLGSPKDILDDDGKPREDKLKEKTPFSALTQTERLMQIGYLKAKDNRESSGDLFNPENKINKPLVDGQGRATILKASLIEYKNLLIGLSEGNQALSTEIEQVFDMSDNRGNKRDKTWEHYNFHDMPAVGALTILSKIQSDLRNVEASVINYLKRNIDAKTLKFDKAEAIQIPQTNFVLSGDSFRSDIFLSAKNSLSPEVYVGEYDSVPGEVDQDGDPIYAMRGAEGVDYEVVRVINGKGIYATRTRSVGSKEWGGLIAMKTEAGTKFYPFAGRYLVAAKTAVVSPTKMNILYTGLEAVGGNPIQVSVPGYTADKVTAVINNGKLVPINKTKGEYMALPAKVTKDGAEVTLFVNVDGKRTRMGSVLFRVKRTPPPTPYIKAVDENGMIDKTILEKQLVMAELIDFQFEGLKYAVKSFRLAGVVKGIPKEENQLNGMGFTNDQKFIIANADKGSTITISNIVVQLIGGNQPAQRTKAAIAAKIK